jgi:hypothetical protein
VRCHQLSLGSPMMWVTMGGFNDRFMSENAGGAPRIDFG